MDKGFYSTGGVIAFACCQEEEEKVEEGPGEDDISDISHDDVTVPVMHRNPPKSAQGIWPQTWSG